MTKRVIMRNLRSSRENRQQANDLNIQADNMSNRTYNRRIVTLGALSALGVTAACGNGVGGRGSAMIDARVDATLAEMYRGYPNTRQLAEKANGMLVMPLVTEAGLGFGGAYGRGALRVNDVTVDYYSVTKASGGLQIGAQQYAHVLFFMTEPALREFRSSPGWAAGAGLEYVISDKGDSVSADTTTVMAPVLAAVFGRAGLRLGATLEGTKYTRIIP
ncbi:Las17-binding protein actin regulator [Sulfitobacter dubius]|nr:Las17-binding protein actin regulator [Sulfitobacter dubius]|tara:strand:- start:1316 stop:1969 length:654 start_codon:yes stop_codon:yes gene_type:complete